MSAPAMPTPPADVAGAFEAAGIEPPNLFLVGAAKAGTTSLWHHLAAHPDVFMTTPKEPHFFTSFVHATAIREPHAYARLFERAAGERYRGEASATYLADPAAAGRIRATFGRPAVLVSLRDPVERAYADYLMSVRFGRTTASFEECVRREVRDPPPPDRSANRFVQQGFYADHLERWLGAFGDSVHAVFFEELYADVRAGMCGVLERLGLDPAPADRLDPAPVFPYEVPRNRTIAAVHRIERVQRLARRVLRGRVRAFVESAVFTREKPPLPEGARRFLEEVYEPHDERLRRLLGRPLPWDGRR
jgi:hypothetical protein